MYTKVKWVLAILIQLNSLISASCWTTVRLCFLRR